MSDSEQTVVLDAGSGTVKAGFAGDDTPKVIFESVIGRPEKSLSGAGDSSDIQVGPEIQKLKDIDPNFIPIRPIKNGIVDVDPVNFEDFQEIINYTYMNELKKVSRDNSLIFLCSPNASNAFKEKITEMAFETLNVSKFQLLNQAVSSLYSTGKTTGLVLESGYESTSITPIQEDYAIYDCAESVPIAGKHLTEQLIAQTKQEVRNKAEFTHENRSRLDFFEFDLFNKQKEDNCVIARDFKSELEKINKQRQDQCKPLILPDKSEVPIDLDRQRVPEAMFAMQAYRQRMNESGIKVNLDDIKQRKMQDKEVNLQNCIENAIMGLPLDLKNEILNNIILSGGNTMFKGFKERLNHELKQKNFNKDIVSKPERRQASWIGGSIVSSIPSFQQQYWITSKEQFEKEGGVSIVHKKCM